MIHLTSITGPEVHGKGRYKVENPAPLDCTSGAITDWGLSGRNVFLDGEVVFVHHVAHRTSHEPRERTLILVTRPSTSKPERRQCKDLDDAAFLRKLYPEDTDAKSVDITFDVIRSWFSDWPRNLVKAKLNRLIERGYALGYTDRDHPYRTTVYELTGKGDQIVEKWYGHEIR